MWLPTNEIQQLKGGRNAALLMAIQLCRGPGHCTTLYGTGNNYSVDTGEEGKERKDKLPSRHRTQHTETGSPVH